jgi:hypothetical protein
MEMMIRRARISIYLQDPTRQKLATSRHPPESMICQMLTSLVYAYPSHLLEPSAPVYLAPQQLQPMMIQTCQTWISSWVGHLLPERSIFRGTSSRFRLRPRDSGGEISSTVIRRNLILSLAESQRVSANCMIGQIQILNEVIPMKIASGRGIHLKRLKDLQVLAPWSQYPPEESKLKMSTVDRKVKMGLRAEAKPTAIHTKW